MSTLEKKGKKKPKQLKTDNPHTRIPQPSYPTPQDTYHLPLDIRQHKTPQPATNKKTTHKYILPILLMLNVTNIIVPQTTSNIDEYISQLAPAVNPQPQKKQKQSHNSTTTNNSGNTQQPPNPPPKQNTPTPKGAPTTTAHLKQAQWHEEHHTNLKIGIISFNIRTLNELKIEGILELVQELELEQDITIHAILISEAKISQADPLTYLQNDEWQYHAHFAKISSTNLITLTRKGTALTHETHETTKQIKPKNQMTSFSLQNELWNTELKCSTIYWPSPHITQQQIQNVENKTHHLQLLDDYMEQTKQDIEEPAHVIWGDFNLHLKLQQETHLSQEQINVWGTRIPHTNTIQETEADRMLWASINEHKYVIASSRSKAENQDPTTWIKTDNLNAPRSTVDYVIANKKAMWLIHSCEPIKDGLLKIDSDHEPILTILHIPKNKANRQYMQQAQTYDKITAPPPYAKLLKNTKRKTAYLDHLQKQTQPLLQRLIQLTTQPPHNKQKVVDTILHSIIDICTHTLTAPKRDTDLKTATASRPFKQNIKNTALLRDEPDDTTLQNLRQAVKTTQKQLKEHVTEILRHTATANARQAQKKLTAYIAKKKNTKMLTELQNITLINDNHTDKNQPTQNIWKYIRKINKHTQDDDVATLPTLTKNQQGILLTCPIKSAQQWHKTRSLISGPHHTRTLASQTALFQHTQKLKWLEKQENTDKDNASINAAFTKQELTKAINTLPTRKAPGKDHLPYELIKIGRIYLTELLLLLFNYMWEKETHPTQWDTGIIKMIFKQGDKSNCTNYRAIVLLDSTMKIYEHLIGSRLRTHIKDTNCLSDNQFGFKEDAHTTEAVHTLISSININKIENQKPTYAAFLDFERAFPATCRPALWNILHEKKVTGKIWRNIRHFYDNLKCRVLHPIIKDTDTYPITTGLIEGSKLSPTLYTFFIDSLLTHLKQKNIGLKIKTNQNNTGIWLGGILYADDLVLLADTPQELQTLINETQTWATQHMAVISVKKTKIVAFHEPARVKRKRATTQHGWYVANTAIPHPSPQQLSEQDNFTYLGVNLDQKLTLNTTLKQSLQSFWNAHKDTTKIGMHEHGLHPALKITLWKQLVLSKINHTLPFLHIKHHLTTLNTALGKSLTYAFTPQAFKHCKTLPIALRADLGIPHITTIQDTTLLRLHAHLETIPQNRPSAQLHAHAKTLNERKYTRTLLPTLQIKHTLQKIGQLPQWHKFAPTIINTTIPPPKPQTIRTNWINTLSKQLLIMHHQQLEQWAGSSPHPKSRPHTYLTLTLHDRLRALKCASPARNPFQPAVYITSLSSANLTSSILRLRTQTSPIPSHTPWDESYLQQVQNTTGTSTNNRHTDYERRHCQHCTPPPHTWGINISPGPNTPQGNESHLGLQCPQYNTHRTTLYDDLNDTLKQISPIHTTQKHPWNTLPEEEKLLSLLAVAPPGHWKIPNNKIKLYMTLMETQIQKWWQPILHDAHQWHLSSHPDLDSSAQ